MKKMTCTTLCLVALVSLSGCQSIKSLWGKRDDGSLHYRESKKLAPLKLPRDQQSAHFIPLYETPNIDASQVPAITNDSGKQYQLPTPPKVVR